jgi:NACHT domain
MSSSVDDRVLDFYGRLFDRLFSKLFRVIIPEQRRQKIVIRQVEEAADAASSSLSRFFQSQKLSEATVESILLGFAEIENLLTLDNISNANVTTEEIVSDLLDHFPCPITVQQTHDAVYRVALHNVVQVLMLVGPVMAEWKKLNFSTTFELPRRVVNRLNEISAQIDAIGHAGHNEADESFEIQYRDYLMQRFHKVEAGTVRMTTSLDVDLRELFVMPRVMEQKRIQQQIIGETDSTIRLMNLSAARRLYGDRNEDDRLMLSEEEDLEDRNESNNPTALELIVRSARNVIVGLPGAGKSTFFEWLQVKLASVEERLILGDQQAIPLMLRVRQLDLLNLPTGAALIEKATASKDRAALMPKGWIDRQMKAGRILLMLDGLDETEPDLRDKYLLPWLLGLVKAYPKCHYLISSRPVGYAPGSLDAGKFVECDLLDFDETQIRDYTRHWCTAVRLAQNELEAEARREGKRDGDKIEKGFWEHPYIRNLARNPLMLSAICLVNYFEGGSLPDDRALLYRLCVEGLLHNWDKRRGINSEFGFNEKLRACREVALVMQSEDRAEFEADRVKAIFTTVLDDPEQAAKLLEHIRYRTGLLLERRPNVFGFAHLTFQEYLAARAIHEGNRQGIDANQLVREHDDGRWKEVIALYCGQATTPVVRELIENLTEQSESISLEDVLIDAYFSASYEVTQDEQLRLRILQRVASLPALKLHSRQTNRLFSRFSNHQVAAIANNIVGMVENSSSFSNACFWLSRHPGMIEKEILIDRLFLLQDTKHNQIGEIIFILAQSVPKDVFQKMIREIDITILIKIKSLSTNSCGTSHRNFFNVSLAEVAFLGLFSQGNCENLTLFETEDILLILMQTINNFKCGNFVTFNTLEWFVRNNLHQSLYYQYNTSNNTLLAMLSRQLSAKIRKKQIEFHHEEEDDTRHEFADNLNRWADLLEGVKSVDNRTQKSAIKKQSKQIKSKK